VPSTPGEDPSLEINPEQRRSLRAKEWAGQCWENKDLC
jgi:hypothetical protein